MTMPSYKKKIMSNKVTIKKGLKLGELDAEADTELLSSCYVDNGQFKQILDVSSPMSVVVGRTGAGKSALLFKILQEAEHSVLLDPNDISIRFLEYSNIIQFFNELGVKLDLFYRVLWRHILTVELLKLRYGIEDQGQSRSFVSRMEGWTRQGKIKARALEYFNEWGDKFWLDTDEHLKELTKKFSADVKTKLGTKYPSVDISLEGAKALSEEVKTEVKSLATQVVSSIQIKKLADVLELLAENSFSDRQKAYYILIDKLDEDWAETETRCRFIRALIEETKSLRKIPMVKVVASLRRDLLDLVFDKTRDSGFQQEKYESTLLILQWSKDDLKEILNQRVSEVYKKQYTSESVSFNDVFPSSKNGAQAIDYIVERTLYRPRDAIQFANECFITALGRDRISWRALHAAEANYSMKRLKSLWEEWSEYYPALEHSVEILRGLTTPFTRSALSGKNLESVSLELHELKLDDPCVKAIKKFYSADSKISISEFDVIAQLLMVFYHVGIIGIKISTLDTFIWSHCDQPRITKGEVKRSNQIKIHKMFRHALEIKDSSIASQMPFKY